MVKKRNLAHAKEEIFRPFLFKPNDTWRHRLENTLRLFFDLQAGSIWRDAAPILGRVHGRVIDIGCGAQTYRLLLPPDVTYLGIDIAAAREKFGYALPDTQYFEGNNWGVADAAFDAALCTEVLEHVRDPAPFLAQCWRCLKPGGQLLLTVPFAARWHFVPYDYWRYTPSALHHLLSEAGFSDICIYAGGNPLTVACYKTMALIIGLAAGREKHRLLRRLTALALLPVFAVLAGVANITLAAEWGEDCLGYTVLAQRPGQVHDTAGIA